MDSQYKYYISATLFKKDCYEILTIPVTLSVHPRYSQQFSVHVVLKFGIYITKIDSFQNVNHTDVFCRTKRIGNATEKQSLIEYSTKLLLRYIEKEAVWLEN